VRAAADGLVVYVGTELRGVGRAVLLLHRNGWVTVYGSTDRVHVEVGQQVQRGAWIAEVGASGGGEAHLFFQLRVDGAVAQQQKQASAGRQRRELLQGTRPRFELLGGHQLVDDQRAVGGGRNLRRGPRSVLVNLGMDPYVGRQS